MRKQIADKGIGLGFKAASRGMSPSAEEVAKVAAAVTSDPDLQAEFIRSFRKGWAEYTRASRDLAASKIRVR